MAAGEAGFEAGRPVFVDEMGTNTSLAPLYASGRDERGASVRERSAQLGGERHPAGEHERGRDGAVPGGRRPDHEGGLRGLPKGGVGALLKPGQLVVMDNLSSHKGPRVRELIEEKGCEVLYLPPYSPDLDPIEEAFAKLKALLCAEPGRVPARRS
jgi:hypothetical protein